MEIFWDILSEEQTEILPHLSFLKKKGFYLAGGTALALQIKHRTSLDFDFYSEQEFLPEEMIDMFQRETGEITVIQTGEGTLICRIKGANVSFFRYGYESLDPSLETEHLNIASLIDIAAMKLIAIIQRGIGRDFLDLYFLAKDFGLRRIIKATAKKYPPFNLYLALQALTYYEDAEKENLEERKIVFFKHFSWDEIKEYFIKEVKTYKEELT